MDRDLSTYPEVSPVTLTHSAFPATESVAGSISMPIGLFATPMINLADRRSTCIQTGGADSLYKVDRDFSAQRCMQCFGYINKYCELSSNRYHWYCSLCGFRNTFPKDRLGRFKKGSEIGYSSSRHRFNNSVFEGIPELTETLYDVPWSNSEGAEVNSTTSSSSPAATSIDQARGQTHILLIHESGPEDALSAVLKAVSQAIVDLNDNILICIITFSHTRIGIVRFFGDMATVQYFCMNDILSSSKASSSSSSFQEQGPSIRRNTSSTSIISDFFDFFVVANRVGNVRRALLRGINCIQELRDKQGYEYVSGSNHATKDAFKTTYECVLDWILGGIGEKVEGEGRGEEGGVSSSAETASSDVGLEGNSNNNSKASGGLLGGLWGGIRSTIVSIKDGLLGKDEAFADTSSGDNGSSSSRAASSSRGKGIDKRSVSPADQCCSIIIHSFFTTFLENENVSSNSSNNSNSSNKSTTNNADTMNKLNSEWSSRISDLIKDKIIINNIWIVNSFKSYQFNIAPFMPLVAGSGGKVFRVVLGHLPQSGLTQLTEQVIREFQEQRFIIKALKLRSSPGIEMNRFSVIGNVLEHGELFNVYRSNSMTSESSFGCQMQWNPNKYVDTSLGNGSASNRPGIDGAVYVQLAVAYETLVDTLGGEDDEDDENDCDNSDSEHDNGTDTGTCDISSGERSLSLYEDVTNLFGFKDIWRLKIASFIDTFQDRNSAKSGRYTQNNVSSTSSSSSTSTSTASSSSSRSKKNGSNKKSNSKRSSSSSSSSIQSLVEKAQLELKAESSSTPLTLQNDGSDSALSQLSAKLLRARRSNYYNRSGRLVVVKRLRIITYRIDLSSKVTTVLQSINPPALAHLITMLSLKTSTRNSSSIISQSIESIRNFCIYFLSGVSFLVVKKDENMTIRDILLEIETMPTFHETVRLLFGAYDLMLSMMPKEQLLIRLAKGSTGNSVSSSSAKITASIKGSIFDSNSNSNSNSSSSSKYSVSDSLESGNNVNFNYDRINLVAGTSHSTNSPSAKSGNQPSFSVFPTNSTGSSLVDDSNSLELKDELSEILRFLDLYDPGNLQVLYLPHLIPVNARTLKISSRPLPLTRNAMVTTAEDLYLLDTGTDVILYRGLRSEESISAHSNRLTPSDGNYNNSINSNNNSHNVSNSSSNRTGGNRTGGNISNSGNRNVEKEAEKASFTTRNVEIYTNANMVDSNDNSGLAPNNKAATTTTANTAHTSTTTTNGATTAAISSGGARSALAPGPFSDKAISGSALRDDPDWILNDLANRIAYSPIVAQYSVAQAGTSTASLFSSQMIEDSSRATNESFSTFRDSLITEAISRYFSSEK